MRDEASTPGDRLQEEWWKQGGAEFHATGIKRICTIECLTMLATGIRNDVKHPKVEEFFNCKQVHGSLTGMFARHPRAGAQKKFIRCAADRSTADRQYGCGAHGLIVCSPF
jgi:hypothetical protein